VGEKCFPWRKKRRRRKRERNLFEQNQSNEILIVFVKEKIYKIN